MSVLPEVRAYATPAEAMRAAFVRWLAREARGVLGVFRPDLIAARMGCDRAAFRSALTRECLAEWHGHSGLWRLTPAGLDAVEAARAGLAAPRDGGVP